MTSNVHNPESSGTPSTYIVDEYPLIPAFPKVHDKSRCKSVYNTVLFDNEISELASGSLTYSDLMRRHKRVHICVRDSDRFITLTLVTNNHPEYLRTMLQSVRVAYDLASPSLRGLVRGLYIFCEPHLECVEVCRAVDWIPVEVHVNPTQQGVRQNPYNALDYVFNEIKSPFNLHLEDDLIVSPNTFSLVEFYFTRFKTNPDRYLVFELFHYISPHEMYIESNTQNKVYIRHGTHHFAGLGWITSRKHWNRHIRSVWFQDLYPDSEHTGLRKGWNWTLSHLILSKKWKTVVPAYPHSTHLGERWLGVENPPMNRQVFTDKWTNRDHFDFLIVDRKHDTIRPYYIDGVDNVRKLSLIV